jgi:hypothetical protein
MMMVMGAERQRGGGRSDEGLEGLAEPSAGHSNRLRRPEPFAGFAHSGKEAGTKRSAFPFVLGG